MARKVVCLLALAWLIAAYSPQTFSQIVDASAVRSDGAATSAAFTFTLSTDGGISAAVTPSTDDAITINTVIQPDTDDMGQSADIYIVSVSGGQVLMRNSTGSYVPWSGEPTDLVPYQEGVTLTAATQVSLYSGALGAGKHRYFVGYWPAGGNALVYSKKAARFTVIEYVVSESADIIGPESALLDEPLSFQLNPALQDSNVTYTWDFADGSESVTGTSANHSFSEPNRYMVRVTRSDAEATYYHYVNIGRAYEDTAFPMYSANALAPKPLSRDFSWNDCNENWETYEGKYNRLWLESTIADQITDKSVIRFLAYADYLFDAYSSLIGWEFGHEDAALDTYICESIPGGGTGTGGSFYGYEVLTDLNEIADEQFSDFGYLPHEMLHLWDFRGGAWINSRDTAHAFTSGMEPILSQVLGIGWNMSAIIGEKQVRELSPDYIFNMYFHIALQRYLDHPELDWEHLNNDEFLALAYDDLPLPENKEHMLVPGGLLMSLYNMHGSEGLRKLFAELEKLLLAHPEWASAGVGYEDLDKHQRAQNFMDAMANALELDVSDYFAYWKYPVNDTSVTSLYPKSDKMEDHDGDGVSPLHGDRDDTDASVYPYAPELMDGKDNNQDGLVDEHVYSENASEVSYQDVTLPFFATGSIANLDDEDNFSFTLSEPGYVVLNVYAKDSATAVEYEPGSISTASILQGALRMDSDYVFPIILPFVTAPHVFGAWYLDAGPHVLSINARLINLEPDPRNPNPGTYEVQMFVNDYETRATVESLLEVVYPGKYSSPAPITSANGL